MICIIDIEKKYNFKWAIKDTQNHRIIIEAKEDCTEDFGEQRCFAVGEALYQKGSYTQEKGYRHVLVSNENISMTLPKPPAPPFGRVTAP